MQGKCWRCINANVRAASATSGYSNGRPSKARSVPIRCQTRNTGIASPHVAIAATSALCLAFIALRTLYLGLYLGDKPSVRTPVWALGLLTTLALYALAIVGG